MAKFTLTFSTDEDIYEIVENIAKQNGLSVDAVDQLVTRFTDGYEVTLQFDTVKNKCWVLFNGKEGINDLEPPKRDVIIKTIDLKAKYFEGRKAHMETLQSHIDEALDAYQQETDKKSSAAKNLLRFIEDTRQELNAFKATHREDDDEDLLSAVHA